MRSPLLLALLLLAYLGASLVGSRSARGWGLSSSVEFVVLGFILGPALGVVDRDSLTIFDPVTHMATGWVGLLAGANYGKLLRQPGKLGSVAVGGATALLTTGAIFGLLWAAIPLLLPLPQRERLMMAASVAVVSSETSRHAVRWVIDRHRAEGPLSTRLNETTLGAQLVPALLCALLFASRPPVPVSAPLLMLAGPALGAVLGLLTATLLGREFRLDESWRLLLGASLLAIGLSSLASLSTLSTTFFLGASLSLSSEHRREILAMVAPTERAVLFPALLLAGARLDIQTSPALLALSGVALLGRLATKTLQGLAMRRSGQNCPPWVGLGLTSSGGFALCVGLSFSLRFHGVLGDVVLTSAAIAALVGEFIGPGALRASLERCGELPPQEQAS